MLNSERIKLDDLPPSSQCYKPNLDSYNMQTIGLFFFLIATAVAFPAEDEAVVDLVQGTDGYYKYSLKSKNITLEEERLVDGSVTGYYAYIDKDGNKQVIHYTSGVGGYTVEGPSVPVDLPEVAQARQAHLSVVDQIRSILPALKSDFLVDEQPEVPLSKEEFLQAVAKVLNPNLPVALEETPEVNAAKKQFLEAFSNAL